MVLMERRSQAETVLAGAAYGMLFVLGLVLGVVGGFTQALYLWEIVPLPAVAWVIVLFGASLGAGRMMGTKLGASALAIGWLLVSLAFSMQRAAGDLIISGPTGIIYLYGGMVAVLVGVMLAPSQGGSWLLRQGGYGLPPK
jgi:hypothetical protein